MPDKYITKISSLPGVKMFCPSDLEAQCVKQMEEPYVSVQFPSRKCHNSKLAEIYESYCKLNQKSHY